MRPRFGRRNHVQCCREGINRAGGRDGDISSGGEPGSEGNVVGCGLPDYVEEAWGIVDPLLKEETPVYQYESGEWGP